jgi:hypothetical protein
MSVDALVAEARAQLALDTKEGRKAAYAKLMDAFACFAQPGLVAEGAPLFTLLGDVYWQAGEVRTALRAWTDAVSCPKALRLGKARFELKEFDRAADELARAFMGGGRELLEREEPRYFDFLKTRLSPPAGEQW